MFAILKRHPRAFVFSLMVHIVFAVMLGTSLHLKNLAPISKPEISVVEAVAIDEKQVATELKRIKDAETRKQRQLQRQLQQTQQKRLNELKRLEDLKRKQVQEKKVEQQRLAKLKQQQKAIEQQRQEEEQRLKEAEQQRRREEQALQEIDKARKEEELRRKLAEEQQRIAEQQSQERQSLIDRYRAMIEAEVRKHWQVPPGAKPGMVCELSVRLLPSGEVIRVELVKSSGNSLFDRSVQTAVRKASPLPVPPASSGLFDVFRDLRFPFKLEGNTLR